MYGFLTFSRYKKTVVGIKFLKNLYGNWDDFWDILNIVKIGLGDNIYKIWNMTSGALEIKSLNVTYFF